MSSSGESSCSGQGLVDGADVDTSAGLLSVRCWDQLDRRHISEKLFWSRLSENVCLITPPSTLNKEPRHIAPSLGFLLYLLRYRYHPVLKPDSIDGDAGETSVVLQSTGDEGLREEET